MKVNGLALTFVALVSLLFYFGCVKPGGEPLVRSGIAPANSTVTSTGEPCDYSYDTDSSSYLKKGSVKVKTGQPQCTLLSETDKIYISSDEKGSDAKEVIFMPPTEFKTKGSCRYCYINSSGGMSCISYTGPFCP
jgi:hypothetical protein